MKLTYGLFLGILLVLATSILHAQETRNWKSEPGYSPELYPDAPHIRHGAYNQQPIAGKLLRVKRPLLIVSDLERSLKFYVDVIGLELYSVDPYYDRNPQSLGYEMFGVAQGARKRMAMLNTSNEIRGITTQEIKDMPVKFEQRPRAFTVLFETDDLFGIRQRAQAAGFRIIEPQLADIPETTQTPRLRFAELAVIDPDDHVVAFFQYFESDEAWRTAEITMKNKGIAVK